MTRSQHVWVRPDATTFAAECEACRYARDAIPPREIAIRGTLRRDADVGFTTCVRGHRIVVRRIGRAFAAAS
jgi:hypothetical protein